MKLWFEKDLSELRADITPLRSGWRFDIHGGNVSEGDNIWRDTGVDSYGFAATREKAEKKAGKRMDKIVKRYTMLRRKGSTVYHKSLRDY